MLPKLPIVFGLILAAAVIIPLRRAQIAFAAHAARARGSVAPRPTMRRRLIRPEVVSPREAGCQRQNTAEFACAAAKASKSPVEHEVKARPTTSAVKHHGQIVAHDVDWSVPGRVGGVSPPEWLCFVAPAPQLAAASQAFGEIPHPPPRRLAA